MILLQVMMKYFIKAGFIGILVLWISQQAKGQHLSQIDARLYVSDSILVQPRRPWQAATETFGINLLVWGFNRYISNAEFAKINGKTIKRNFRTGPVWDTDMFSTNLASHPYHGSLYFNAARSNGMNFWQSIPFVFGGSLMWEFFMERELPSINDLIATTFGGVALGEITYRLSDLFIDHRASGIERVGREILSGVISPIRALNRMITGNMWKTMPFAGRAFNSVPVNMVIGVGPRFLAEPEHSGHGVTSMNLSLNLNYGDPHDDESYSPYEWFRLHASFDFFSKQPLVSQVNAIGALWGKAIWKKDSRALTAGIFQHFDYYNSQLKSMEGKAIAPYRISEAAAVGGGLIYKKSAPDVKLDMFADYYLNVIILGASASDHFMIDERDYNWGSGYSTKGFFGLVYNKRWFFTLNAENYHIFTWKGYKPDIDLSKVDPETLNVQGDKSNARLTVLSTRLGYFSNKMWNVTLTNRWFSRETQYKYYCDVETATTDAMLTIGISI